MVRLLLHSLCKHIHYPSVNSTYHLLGVHCHYHRRRWRSQCNLVYHATYPSYPVRHISVPIHQSPLPKSQAAAGDKTQTRFAQIAQISLFRFGSAALRPGSHRSLRGRRWSLKRPTICVVWGLRAPSFVPL